MKYLWRTVIVLAAFAGVAVFAGYSQIRNAQKSSKPAESPQPASTFKLAADKPGVFVEFVRTGKRPPPGDDVSDEAVWLRLHNNMRCAISFCAFSLLDDKGQLLSLEKAGELGVNYEVEVTDATLFDRTKLKVPSGNRSTGFCHVFTLGAGESVVFSVPKEHLARGLSVKVPFNYEWEDQGRSNPSHHLYFDSKDMPR